MLIEKSKAFSVDYSVAQALNPSFLFVVHNDIEFELMLKAITPPTGYQNVLKVTVELQPYYVGNFGAQLIVLVKTGDMGSTKPFASTTTMIMALTHWQPFYVIMVGVLAGICKDAKIGDVVIARESIDYQSKKEKDDAHISRNHHYYSGRIYNLFDSLRTSDLVCSSNGKPVCRIKKGVVLSGDILLDSISYREELRKEYPEALGLEMEFKGVASACISANITQIMMIKGVCDLGANKGENKDRNQRLAMRNAIELCRVVFNDNLHFAGSPLKHSYSNTINRSVLISGSHNSEIDENSALTAGVTNRFIDCKSATDFSMELAVALQTLRYRIVTGYGREIGQAVIGGILYNVNMQDTSHAALEEYLVSMPFPLNQSSGSEDISIKNLRSKYRQIICQEAKYNVVVFGLKSEDNVVVRADGVMEETKTSHRLGSMIIPVGSTEFAAREIWMDVRSRMDEFYPITGTIKLKQRKAIRDECFEALGKRINFKDRSQRKNLIADILAFMKRPWEIIDVN